MPFSLTSYHFSMFSFYFLSPTKPNWFLTSKIFCSSLQANHPIKLYRRKIYDSMIRIPCSLHLSTMALVFISFARIFVSTTVVFYILISCCIYGKGDDLEGGASSGLVGYEDPPEIVAKALLCFNDKYIYSACEESCRLTGSGNLEVPLEKTEEYCNGPCLDETHLVLDCINSIFNNFLFYNTATLQDVRDTIHAGCAYGPQRGNFDVIEHIRAERGNACRVSNKAVLGFSFIILGLFNLLV